MEKFHTVSGRAIPLGLKNVDTDVILPATHLKVLTREGLGRFAFHSLRYDDDGAERPDCVLNQDRYRNSEILIVGENFGCGSSREHAVWAMAEMGIRVVISSSFADIFSGNAFKNGILTVQLRGEDVQKLLTVAHQEDVVVDLETQTVTTRSAGRFWFYIDPFRKECLWQGHDEIALAEQFEAAIAAYEANLLAERNWVLPSPAAPK